MQSKGPSLRIQTYLAFTAAYCFVPYLAEMSRFWTVMWIGWLLAAALFLFGHCIGKKTMQKSEAEDTYGFEPGEYDPFA